MKRFFSAVLLLTVFAACATAQEDPIPPPRRVSAPKVGLFGGFTPAWLKLDVGAVNQFLADGKGAPLKDNGVFLTGGGGAIYVLVVKNARLGGVGMAGSIRSTSIDLQGIRRDAELSVGFGGVTVEYVFTLMERLDLAVGTMLGSGSLTLTLRQNAGGNTTWLRERDLFASWPPSSSINTRREMSGSFVTIVPTVNLEYAVLGWLGVRLGASYVLMFAPGWTVDGDYDLPGVPSDVSGRGFMAHAGIFVGTF